MLTSLGTDPATMPAEAEDRADRFRTLTTGRRLLLVLYDAADEAQLEVLLAGSPTCSVLATSRSRLTGLADVVRTEVGALPVQAAVELLSVVVGRQRVRAEPNAALRIIAACDRLPLGVRLAGARLAAQPD
ncbi:NB-ARC domain-containing protein [Actinoplanes sp. Pm04-4]|uniref:NB-ARC domain-containing protein n=1 Tax=Paractinoplanes pyxinae TaxID=2997416 RepID=A0ABT4BCZ7_9ACTN|nr:NB-ARC domain-containing protein [Actinoplanes pyxinae]MCY1143710.1 NB-ARC domain-containing protein [Actinoplanes pyxinae]